MTPSPPLSPSKACFRAQIYHCPTIARAKEACLRMNAKEDGREDNVDFQDQNLAFNKELEKVGVVARELKRPIKKRVFQCWLSKEERGGERRRMPFTRPSF